MLIIALALSSSSKRIFNAKSNVEGGRGMEEVAQGLLDGEGCLYSDKLFAGVPCSELRHCS